MQLKFCPKRKNEKATAKIVVNVLVKFFLNLNKPLKLINFVMAQNEMKI